MPNELNGVFEKLDSAMATWLAETRRAREEEKLVAVKLLDVVKTLAQRIDVLERRIGK